MTLIAWIPFLDTDENNGGMQVSIEHFTRAKHFLKIESIFCKKLFRKVSALLFGATATKTR